MNITQQTEAIKREAIAAANGGKGPESCPYTKGSDAEIKWKDVFYHYYSLRPMTFAVRQLEAASQYKPQTMDIQIRSISQTRESIRNAIAERPGATIEHIKDRTGLGKQTVRRYVRELVDAGAVEGTLGNNKDRETRYRTTAEP